MKKGFIRLAVLLLIFLTIISAAEPEGDESEGFFSGLAQSISKTIVPAIAKAWDKLVAGVKEVPELIEKAFDNRAVRAVIRAKFEDVRQHMKTAIKNAVFKAETALQTANCRYQELIASVSKRPIF